ncbi:MAG: hypothetical protein LBI33_12820 [Propionibacteriaceae bacterium]|jgi:hypothetical protein|nr:hypothetical protein [Propionibacteriaceae bacterium]
MSYMKHVIDQIDPRVARRLLTTLQAAATAYRLDMTTGPGYAEILTGPGCSGDRWGVQYEPASDGTGPVHAAYWDTYEVLGGRVNMLGWYDLDDIAGCAAAFRRWLGARVRWETTDPTGEGCRRRTAPVAGHLVEVYESPSHTSWFVHDGPTRDAVIRDHMAAMPAGQADTAKTLATHAALTCWEPRTGGSRCLVEASA